jgi:hypothetical protein
MRRLCIEPLENRHVLAGADLPGDHLWHKLEAELLLPAPGAQAQIQPAKFEAYELSTSQLRASLAAAPLEFTAAATFHPLIVDLPSPAGEFESFSIVESPIMEPALAAQFPEIKTYRGQGVDDPTASIRFDVTPTGFHAQVISPSGVWYLDPYSSLSDSQYLSYFKRDLVPDTDFESAEQEDPNDGAQKPPADNGEVGGRGTGNTGSGNSGSGSDALRSSGTQLRTYRLAVAATGEYTAFFGGTVAQAQAAIVTAINRVDGIYENELAVRMVLIANNSSLVYTNASTDPYTNNNGSTMLTENQTNLDTVIGSANYDIGHVFSTGGGGIAGIGVVGVSTKKARGVTGLSSPVGDAFYVDYVAHEMGHQFGGHHSFNGVNGAAAGNVTASTAYEPGSGSTIMAYPGICGADDLQSHSDPYFHSISLDEILTYTTSGAGNTAAVITSTGNNIPQVNAGLDYTIPARSSFALTATGSDADASDVLTYTWEERDLGAAQALSAADNGSSPLFRSFTPTTSPTRVFPKLSSILSNSASVGEQLPTTTRTMNFRAVVRDNRSGGGGINTDDMVLSVVDTGAPFQITSPNSAVTWTAGGNQTVTWDVAGTTASPISAANVNILLSTDGGLTFGTVLAASTPNDGTQVITVPNLSTTTARIKVEAANNIFFDVSNANFTITSSSSPPTAGNVTSSKSNGAYAAGSVIDITVDFSQNVSVTGSPQLQLETGTTDRQATYLGGSGTGTLTFRYTVQAGDTSADLDYTGTGALTLNGGTIKDANGNDATLTLAAPGTAGSLGANKALVIDTTAPVVTDTKLSISGASGTGGAFKVGDTVTATWNNTAATGDNNPDIASVSVNFSQFGGGSAVTATSSSGTWTASYTIVAGGIDGTNRNISLSATDGAGNVTTTFDTTNATVDNQPPVVTDAKLSISGATGTGGTFKIGDTVTASWNNTAASGDNNTDLDSVTVNFSQFGGGSAVTATSSSGIWTATYMILAGSVDGTNKNISASATDNAGNITTTADTTNATADNQPPVVTDAKISISGATGTGGAFKVGDTVTATWNNTAAGDNNADITGVTVNFSQFGGGSAVAATSSSGTWTATYAITAGSIDGTGKNVSLSATDDAGNITTTTDTTNATVDNQPPVVTDAKLSISGATGTGGAFKVGDTVTATWNNTAAGDNNADITGVTVNFIQFGGGSAVAATSSGGTWTATYAITAGSIDGTSKNVSLSATDDAGNITTTTDTTNATVDNQPPVVTDAKLSISGATGIGGAFKVGDTVTATWNNTAAGDNNVDITGVTVNFSQFGGGSAVAATNSSGTWTAIYAITAGSIDSASRNVSLSATDNAGNVTTMADTTNATVDNQPPVVTDAKLSISGATGTGGTFRVGDTVTATWNNTAASGDNNADITSVAVNFSQFGGGNAVAAADSSGTWTATYTIVSGIIDGTSKNVSLSATDDAGNSTTITDTTNATVDNQLPVVTDAKLSISGATGTGGTFRVGDTVTATWNNTAASGDNNADITGVTVSFSQFGGGSAVIATNNSGTWTATYTITAGSIDSTSQNVSLSATDNAGNATTTADTTNAMVDNQPPVVTDAKLSISGATGTGGTFRIGDIVTATWNNTAASGDNNADITGVTVSFSQFGGGSAVVATNNSGIWMATYTITAGSIDSTSRNVSLSATDNAGNVTTTADTTNATVDNQPPLVTDAKLSISGATGTGGAFKVGDTVTATWNNSITGDNNGDVTGVTVNFGQFGGGSAVAATNSSETWTSSYTISGGSIQGSNKNVSLTAIDDSGNITTTLDTTNATVDNQLATISSVASSNLTASGATIAWTTDETADTQVEYGGTTSYGSSSSLNTSLVTSHSVGLSGLAPSTLYHYRVRSRDAAGNLSVSGDFAFTTAPDTTAPSISGVAISNLIGSSLTVDWTTDENADTEVEYGATTSYGNTSALDPSLVTSHSASLTGLTPETTYHYRVRSRDGAGNLALSGDFTFTTTPAATTGLVAQYTFNEGAGSTVIDASGNNNLGTIIGATWSPSGKYGNALSFNGTSNRVDIVDSSSLHLSSAMTLAAWVNPTLVSSVWQDVIYKGSVNYYLMASSSNGGSPGGGGTFGGSTQGTFAPTPLTANTWTYLAATYDGSAIRLYVNGTLVSTTAKTGAITSSSNLLQIGGNTISGQYFSGKIDEIRIYNRSLTQAEIQANMNAAGDTTAPTISGIGTSNITEAGVTVEWTTDEAADTQVEYGTTVGYGDTSPANFSMLTSHSVDLAGLAPSTTYHYRVRSRDAYGNLTISGDSTFTTSADTTPPVISNIASSGLFASGATVAWTTNEGADTQVEYGTTTGYGSLTALNTAMVTSHSASLSGLASSTTYHYRVHSHDVAGNLATSGDFTFTTTSLVPGLVAQYTFNEGAGSSVIDSSGNGNVGTLVGASWSTTGKYKNALSFNGTSSRIDVLDSPSLHLTTAMTLEAWVKPTVVSSIWQDVISKGNVNYYLMASSSTSGRPTGGGTFGGSAKGTFAPSALTANTWTHLAATYDGGAIRLYVNGTLVSTTAQTGTIKISPNPLQIGGNTISGQYFKGLIDEIRIYNRALNQTQIRSDMNAVGDITSPTVSGIATSNLTPNGVTVAWTTNEAADTQVDFGTTTSYGSASTRDAAQVTSHSVNLANLAGSTTYHYRVRSRDLFGNLTISADATFTTPVDVTAPVISGVATSNLTASAITVSWTTDEWADSQVEFGTTLGYGNTSPLNSSLIANHSVNLTSLAGNTTYHFRVRSRDASGNLSMSGDFTFTTPPGLSLSAQSVVENAPVNTVVGNLTPDDGNLAAPHTYSLLDNAGGRFKIVGSQVQVASSSLLNYEAATSHNITVQVSSSGGPTYQKTFTIGVVNVNEVTGFDVQQGLTERSYVRYVDLVFESTSSLASLLTGSRLKLTRYGLDGTSSPTQISLAGKLTTSGNKISLDFGTQGIGGNRNSNIGDGYYRLSIDQDGDGVYDTTRSFYRLFGDATGDRTVSDLDLSFIVSNYGKTGKQNADVNGDGLVNSTDRTYASQAKGRSLGSGLVVND